MSCADPRPAPPGFAVPQPPAFERLRLSSGLELVTSEYSAVPMVHLLGAVPAGALCDPVGREGLSALTLQALRAGTLRRGAAAVAAGLEDRGADLLVRLGWETATLGIELLADDLDYGIELLAELLWSPAFPPESLEEGRLRQIGALRQRYGHPSRLADLSLARCLFTGTAYGRSLLGTEASLRRIHRDEVVTFYRERYQAAGAVLVAVGPVQPDSIARRIEPFLPPGSQSAGEVPSPRVPRPHGGRQHLLVADLPRAAQTELRLGQPGPGKGHHDAAGLEILGRLCGQRIAERLRDRRGFAYSVSSAYETRRGAGFFFVSTAVEHRYAGEAVREMLAAIERLRQDPVAGEELAAAQHEAAGAFLRGIQPSQGWAAWLQEHAPEPRLGDLFQRSMKAIFTTTPGEILDLARRYLKADGMSVVAAGPAQELRGQFRFLDADPEEVTLLSVENAEKGCAF